MKQINIKIFVIACVLIIVVLGAILVISRANKSSLEGAVFYYKTEGKDSNLFYMKSGKESEHLIVLPSEEIDLDKYKVLKHSYISHNGKTLIYFERIGEVPVGVVSEEEGLMAYKIIYKPKYVDLKSNSMKDIEQDMDSVSLVFSPNDKKIAWVSTVEEATVEELELARKKREVWISNPNGGKAKHLVSLDETVVLFQKWHGNYIYFWGIPGAGHYSIGRINVKNGRVEYVKPKYCTENLGNCKNFRFSRSGESFIYEVDLIEEGKKTIKLFVESFDGEKSWQILVNNYISDRLWLPDEKSVIYTEQVEVPKIGFREKIHQVNLKTNEDKEIYSGNYVSQIVPDGSGKYLYFIEKETDEKFNLIELNIEQGEAKIIDFGEYNYLKIFSGI